MTVGQNIRRIRLQKGLTQKQVAEACNTVDAVIRTYELGRANPKPATVAKIATALGTTPAELYGTTDDPLTQAAICQTETKGTINETTIYLIEIAKSLEQLNTNGKAEAAKRIKELTYIPEFQQTGGDAT